jgi:hypothetical protein
MSRKHTQPSIGALLAAALLALTFISRPAQLYAQQTLELGLCSTEYAVIEGQVLEGSTLLAGADVGLWRWVDYRYWHGYSAIHQYVGKTRSDNEGRYRFEALPLGYYFVTAQQTTATGRFPTAVFPDSLEKYFREGATSSLLAIQMPSIDMREKIVNTVLPITIRRSSAAFTGRVVDEVTKMPVPGVRVSFNAIRWHLPIVHTPESTNDDSVLTNAAGYFTGQVPYAGSYRVWFSSTLDLPDRSYLPSFVDTSTADAPTGLGDIEISRKVVRTRDGVLRGVVRDARTGTPIRGVRLGLWDELDDGDGAQTVSGADGTYELRYFVRPGRYILGLDASTAVGTQISDYASRSISLPLKDSKQQIFDPLLYQGGAIRGRAVDPDGAPVAGMNIIARSIETNSYISYTKTGPDGRFAFNRISEGLYQILGEGDDFVQMLEPQVFVKAGEVAESPDVIAQGKTVIQGRVTYAGTDIVLTGYPVYDSPGDPSSTSRWPVAVTDASGLFQIRPSVTGTYTAVVNGVAYTVAVPSLTGAPINIDIKSRPKTGHFAVVGEIDDAEYSDGMKEIGFSAMRTDRPGEFESVNQSIRGNRYVFELRSGVSYVLRRDTRNGALPSLYPGTLELATAQSISGTDGSIVRLETWKNAKVAKLVIGMPAPAQDFFPAWQRPYPHASPDFNLYAANGQPVISRYAGASGWPFDQTPLSATIYLPPGDYKLAIGGTDYERYFYPDAGTLDAAQVIRVPESGTAITLPRPPRRCPFVGFENVLRLPIISSRHR